MASSSENKSEQRGSFVSDIEEIRRRARQHIENGAVTEAYRSDRETVMRAPLQPALLHGTRDSRAGGGRRVSGARG